MRAALSILFVTSLVPLLEGCDFAFAQETTTMWLSRESLLGMVVKQKGSEIAAHMYLFDEKASMPKPEDIGPDDHIGGMPFSSGVVDTETKTLLFPLKTVNLVAANSARLMRDNGSPYVEFDLDFTRTELEGRWRDGNKKPKLTRVFTRCGLPAETSD